MDVKTFLTELLSCLTTIDFIKDIDIKVEGIVISGRVILKEKMFLEVYYNEVTKTIKNCAEDHGRKPMGESAFEVL